MKRLQYGLVITATLLPSLTFIHKNRIPTFILIGREWQNYATASPRIRTSSNFGENLKKLRRTAFKIIRYRLGIGDDHGFR